MSNSIPIIKFLFRMGWKPFSEAISLQPSYEVKVCAAVSEIENHLSDAPASLIITSVVDKQDLLQLATLIKMSKTWPKEFSIKLVVINFTNDKHFEKAIAKLGIQDVIDAGIATRALKFKMDFWMKSLNAQIKANKGTELVQKSLQAGDPGKSDPKVSSSLPTWQKPLNTENDTWLIKNDGECKKILTKWLVKLRGPSPYVGQWTEVSADTWRFDLKDFDRKSFTPGKGHWFFQGGNKPEFYWSENTWLFTGENFDLFYKENDQRFSRAICKNRFFTICENSKFAEEKSRLIHESCDKDLVFKKEADALGNLEGDVKGEADRLKNLEGKGKTENLEGGPLSGTTKGTQGTDGGPLTGTTKGTEALDRSPLSGATKGTQALDRSPLSGEAKGTDALDRPPYEGRAKQSEGHQEAPLRGATKGTDALDRSGHELKLGDGQKHNSNPLSQKTETAREATHWQGRNEYKELGKADFGGPAGGKPTEGKLLDHENKHHEHQKYYKGHNPAEVYEAKEKAQAEARGKVDHFDGQMGGAHKNPADRSGDLRGSTSTDRLAKNYDNRDHLKKGDQEAADAASDLSGRSATEKLSSHYSKREDVEGSEAKEKKKLQSPADLRAESPSEKHPGQFAKKTRDGEADSAPDQLDESPRGRETAKTGGKKSRRQEGEERNLSGEGSTEKVDAHYRSRERSQEDGTGREERGEESTDPRALPKKDRQEGARGEASSEAPDDRPQRKGAENVLALRQDEETAAKKSTPAPEKKAAGLTEEEYRKKLEKIRAIQKEASVVSLEDARQERNERGGARGAPEEAELEAMAASAKVTAQLKQDRLHVSCDLDDFFDETVILQSQKHGFRVNEKVSLVMHFDYFNKIETLNMHGIVVSEEKSGEDCNYVTVKIDQKNVEQFDVFMKLFKKRQSNVDAFLKSVKGL